MRRRRDENDDIFDEFGDPPSEATPEPAGPDAAPDLAPASVDEHADATLAVARQATPASDEQHDIAPAAIDVPLAGKASASPTTDSTTASGVRSASHRQWLTAAGAVVIALLTLAAILLPHAASTDERRATPTTRSRVAQQRAHTRAEHEPAGPVRPRHHAHAPRMSHLRHAPPSSSSTVAPGTKSAALTEAPAAALPSVASSAPTYDFTFER